VNLAAKAKVGRARDGICFHLSRPRQRGCSVARSRRCGFRVVLLAFLSEPPALWSTDVMVGKEFGSRWKHHKTRAGAWNLGAERSRTRRDRRTLSIRSMQWPAECERHPTQMQHCVSVHAGPVRDAAMCACCKAKPISLAKRVRPIICSQAAGSIIMSWVMASFVHRSIR
jgi:hypothetical protein